MALVGARPGHDVHRQQPGQDWDGGQSHEHATSPAFGPVHAHRYDGFTCRTGETVFLCHPAQVLDKVFGALVAILRVFGDHPHENRRHFVRNFRHQLLGIGREHILMMVEFLGCRPLWHGRFTRQHVIKRAAEGVDIAPRIRLARLQGLLGRDVIKRPKRHPRLRQRLFVLLLQAAGQSHVDQLGTPISPDDDVRWLDVPVDYASFGGMREAGRDLLHIMDGFIHR